MFGKFSDFLKILWPETWHLKHWLHCWQLRTTLLTITLWPLNKEWRGQLFAFASSAYWFLPLGLGVIPYIWKLIVCLFALGYCCWWHIETFLKISLTHTFSDPVGPIPYRVSLHLSIYSSQILNAQDLLKDKCQSAPLWECPASPGPACTLQVDLSSPLSSSIALPDKAYSGSLLTSICQHRTGIKV